MIVEKLFFFFDVLGSFCIFQNISVNI